MQVKIKALLDQCKQANGPLIRSGHLSDIEKLYLMTSGQMYERVGSCIEE